MQDFFRDARPLKAQASVSQICGVKADVGEGTRRLRERFKLVWFVVHASMVEGRSCCSQSMLQHDQTPAQHRRNEMHGFLEGVLVGGALPSSSAKLERLLSSL